MLITTEQDSHNLKNPAWFVRMASFALMGALTSFIAWHTEQLWAVLFIAVAWRYATGFLPAFMMMYAYFLVGAFDFPAIFAIFFPGQHGLGYLLWLLHAALLTLPFALAARYRAAGLVMALLITALPPLGFIGWLSPLLVSGVLFPDLGVAGYLAAGLIFFMIAFHGQAKMHNTGRLLLLLASLYCNFNNLLKPLAVPSFWFGQDTHFSKYPVDAVVGFQRQQQLMKQVDTALHEGAKLILLPESIVGEWQPASEYWWQKEIDLAKVKKTTLLIGAVVDESHGHWSDALIIRGTDVGIARARIPIPVGMWNPFSATGFNSYPGNSGVVSVQGKPVAISMCYEDLLVFPMIQSFLMGKPQALLSSANNWFGQGTDEPAMQTMAINVQARLFGVPLIRALNLPLGNLQ